MISLTTKQGTEGVCVLKGSISAGLLALVLSGCSLYSGPESQQQSVTPAPDQQQLQAAGFSLQLNTPGVGRIERLRLYMDGPGALMDSGKAGGLGWRLSRQDRGSFYARFPCASLVEGEGCDPRYRGEQHYATEQAEAVAQMLAELKRSRQAKTLDVVASGAAVPLMLKVAAIGGSIDHLHTLDGVLSPAIAAKHQGRTMPAVSDPLIFYRQLARQAQTHWVSAGSGPDQEKLAGFYKGALKQSSCVRVRIASTVMKADDWLMIWPVLKDSRFSCLTGPVSVVEKS